MASAIPQWYRKRIEIRLISIESMIAEAEKMIKLRRGNFTACHNLTNCNDLLDLDVIANEAWDFKVDSVTLTTFTASASRLGSDNRVWTTNEMSDGPFCNNTVYVYCDY